MYTAKEAREKAEQSISNEAKEQLLYRVMKKGKKSVPEMQHCFIPEKDNPYPLCVGRGFSECEECQLRADWEPDDLY